MGSSYPILAVITPPGLATPGRVPREKSYRSVDRATSRSSCSWSPQGGPDEIPHFYPPFRVLSPIRAPARADGGDGPVVQKSLQEDTLVEAGGLLPSKDGSRVRLTRGKITVTDGPFTESKEVIGGYAILNAASRADALRIATEFMELHRKYWPEFEGESGVILPTLLFGQLSPDTKGDNEMKTIIMLATTVTCLAASLPTNAQAPAQGDQVFILATYFHCNSATVQRADDAVDKVYKKTLEGLVSAGTVSSYGWLGKFVGGEWLRAGYFTGSNLEDVLAASVSVPLPRSDDHPKMDRKAIDENCSSGEDYVWHVLSGSDPRASRGKVSFSTYYVCDQTRETQADALVKNILGARYDKLVGEKKLTTWTWAEHIIGGKYRRLSTMSAENLKALIEAREALVAGEEHDPVNQAMTSICGSHQDVIWEVLNQGGR
jgi:hypothetical protein